VRFLVDESTGPAVARWLREQGHDAVAVRDVARGAEDEDVLRKAAVEKRILIANDKDFGEMIFRRRQPHAGAVLLRLSDETDENKIRVVEQVLNRFATQLSDNFFVATEDNIRIARFSAQ
jgi:predicted nuclease of predicted toxin-antitoxin system